MNSYLNLLAYATLAFFSTSSMASIITINDNLVDDLYVRTLTSGTFDLESLSSLYTSTYEITSATVQLRFSDDSSDGRPTGSTERVENVGTTDVTFSSSVGYFNRQISHVYNITNTQRDIVLIGDADVSSRVSESTANLEIIGPSYNSVVTDVVNNCCVGTTSFPYKTYLTDVYYNALNDYGADDWGINYSIGPLALQTLIDDGVYNFTLQGANGGFFVGPYDFLLTSATLRLSINENPAEDVAGVPEPSIIALFATGILGIGFARRRKLRQS